MLDRGFLEVDLYRINLWWDLYGWCCENELVIEVKEFVEFSRILFDILFVIFL